MTSSSSLSNRLEEISLFIEEMLNDLRLQINRRRHTKSRFGFSEYDWNYMLRIGFKPICTTS